MNACGIVLITGFMTMLSAVLFRITARSTYVEGLLSTVSTVTLYYSFIKYKAYTKPQLKMMVAIPQLRFLLYILRIMYKVMKTFSTKFC